MTNAVPCISINRISVQAFECSTRSDEKWKLKVIRLLHGHHSVAAQGLPVHYPGITKGSIAPDGTVAHTHTNGAGHGSGTKWKPGHRDLAVRAEGRAHFSPSGIEVGGGGSGSQRLSLRICKHHDKAKIARQLIRALKPSTPV